MGSLFGPSLVTLLVIGLAQSAFAQDRPTDQPATGAATLPWNAPGVLTGKERLGKKWMDAQRIDRLGKVRSQAIVLRLVDGRRNDPEILAEDAAEM
jgi:hypothetical protein